MNKNIDITEDVRKLVRADLPVVDMRGKEFSGQNISILPPYFLVEVSIDGQTFMAYDYTGSTLVRDSGLPPFLRCLNGYCVLIVSDAKDLQSKIALVVEDLLC